MVYSTGSRQVIPNDQDVIQNCTRPYTLQENLDRTRNGALTNADI